MHRPAPELIARYWLLSHHLFDYITYNLRKQKDRRFPTKDLGKSVHILMDGTVEEHYISDYNDYPVAPTGFGRMSVYRLVRATHRLAELLYKGIPLPETPLTEQRTPQIRTK